MPSLAFSARVLFSSNFSYVFSVWYFAYKGIQWCLIAKRTAMVKGLHERPRKIQLSLLSPISSSTRPRSLWTIRIEIVAVNPWLQKVAATIYEVGQQSPGPILLRCLQCLKTINPNLIVSSRVGLWSSFRSLAFWSNSLNLLLSCCRCFLLVLLMLKTLGTWKWIGQLHWCLRNQFHEFLLIIFCLSLEK